MPQLVPRRSNDAVCGGGGWIRLGPGEHCAFRALSSFFLARPPAHYYDLPQPKLNTLPRPAPISAIMLYMGVVCLSILSLLLA